MVRLLVVEPGYCPYIAYFDSVQSAAQEVVSGESKVILPFGTPKIGLLCSKDQSGLRYNRCINEEDIHVYGLFLICGLNGDKLTGLTKEQAERYSRLYFQPQNPYQDADDFPVAKVRPKDERYGQQPRFWER